MHGPVHISGTIDIERPIEDVFDFVADQTNEPLYNPTMTSSSKTSSGPIGPGTTFEARTRNHGKPLDMVIEVTEFQAPRLLRSTTHMAMMDLDGGLTFTPTPTGTRMDWDWNVQPTGLWRFFRPLVKAVGQRNERKIWTGLKAHLEGSGQQRPGHSEAHASLPPRWFVVVFWHAHRALLRTTGGRIGLWRPKPNGWGAAWLTTTGRRSGRPRRVVIGYFDDGPDLVTMAMNGWGAADPAWWRNLQAHPDATVRTRDGVRQVTAHAARGSERARLWSRWAEIDEHLEDYAARRPKETAVVVLAPRKSTP